MNEIFKLKDLLENENIKFEFKDNSMNLPNIMNYKFDENFGKHYQICCPANNENRYVSVVQGYGTYGVEEDLLEIMGLLTPAEEEKDSVIGYLTAEEVLKRIKNYLRSE